ncbi:hypothetical protein BDZ91DRAFT_802382 [Kalaharituber pfeilii]|nr:hypothetical protein BDZ91DRAFT_802382 [Kalaharituber pfeilii]
MGGRLPVKDIIAMAQAADVHAEVHTYTWKEQSEPDDVIGGYVHHQKKGLGPFHWYPVEVLKNVFQSLSAAEAGAKVYQLEAQLEPHKLDALAAYDAYKRGIKIGHTVVVVRSCLLQG